MNQGVPVRTALAAKSHLNKHSLYIVIGDQLGQLFEGLDLDAVADLCSQSAQGVRLLAAVTFFQFAERLADREAADAVRTRLDWKYALHLPLDHPGIAPSALSAFRNALRSDRNGKDIFHAIQSRLARVGYLSNDKEGGLGLGGILATVEALSRAGEAREAMGAALEALASTDPEWLRAIALSHWFDRYHAEFSSRELPVSREGLEGLVRTLGADISYLLEVIEETDAPELGALPEVQDLRRIYRVQPKPNSSNQRQTECQPDP